MLFRSKAISKDASKSTLSKNDDPTKDLLQYYYLLSDNWDIYGRDGTNIATDYGWTISKAPDAFDTLSPDKETVVNAENKSIILENGNLNREFFEEQGAGYYQIYRSNEFEELAENAPVYMQLRLNIVVNSGFEITSVTEVGTKQVTIQSKTVDDRNGFKERFVIQNLSTGEVIKDITASSESISQQADGKYHSNLEITFNYDFDEVYLIKQIVTDCEGAVSTATEQFSRNSTVCALPFSSFALNDAIFTREDRMKITDQSKSTDGSSMSTTYWIQDANGNYYRIENGKLISNQKTKVTFEIPIATSVENIDLSQLEEGTYTIYMTATAQSGNKQPKTTEVRSEERRVGKEC